MKFFKEETGLLVFDRTGKFFPLGVLTIDRLLTEKLFLELWLRFEQNEAAISYSVFPLIQLPLYYSSPLKKSSP